MAAVTPITATQIMADQSRHRLRAAMDHLLYRLKTFVEVRPMIEDDKLPEHDVVWVEYPERGDQSSTPSRPVQSYGAMRCRRTL